MQLMNHRHRQMLCMGNLLQVPCLDLICLQWLLLGGSLGLWGVSGQLLSLNTEEPRSQPLEQELAALNEHFRPFRNATLTVYLQIANPCKLTRCPSWQWPLSGQAGRPKKRSSSLEDEDIAVFCLELPIAIALNIRDRIGLLWQGVYEHIANIVQSIVMPGAHCGEGTFWIPMDLPKVASL